MTKHAWRWAVVTSIVAGAAVGVVACSSSTSSGGSSSFDGGGFHDATTADGGLHRDGEATGDGSSLHRGDGASSSGDGGGLDGACAASKTQATLIPAYLVFVMDRSDSMKQYGKWPACSLALEDFFSDPSATGIYSSLTFMPYLAPDASDTSQNPGYSCDAGAYVKPEVPMAALPSNAFTPVINAESLQLGTPTNPALEGALKYAKVISAAHPQAKVRIVLATDGYPAGCTSNGISDVAATASKAALTDGIPVYVIGVGPESGNGTGISNLNQVAEAGTTGGAFFIPTAVDGGDASVTTQGFLAAVHQIQGTLGCDYSIPAPPAGQTLDFNKVNVVLSSNGADSTLDFSADCSNPSGWKYEDGDGGTPDEIVLCPAACKMVASAGASSSINIELGCDTLGGPK